MPLEEMSEIEPPGGSGQDPEPEPGRSMSARSSSKWRAETYLVVAGILLVSCLGLPALLFLFFGEGLGSTGQRASDVLVPIVRRVLDPGFKAPTQRHGSFEDWVFLGKGFTTTVLSLKGYEEIQKELAGEAEVIEVLPAGLAVSPVFRERPDYDPKSFTLTCELNFADGARRELRFEFTLKSGAMTHYLIFEGLADDQPADGK